MNKDKDKQNVNENNVDKLNNSNKKEEEKHMDAVVERYCPISESLEESLKQMKLIREGKLPKKTWKDFKKELQDEKDKKNE